MSVTIPGFEVQGRLYQHSMGTLYRAVEVAGAPGRREVCLEVFPCPDYRDARAAEVLRLRLEAAALLDHPCIWPVRRIGEHDRALYLVRPLPAPGGEFLEERLRDQPWPARAAAVRWVRQVAAAVQHAHEHGIFHCDVKPGNIFLGPGEVPLLYGFDCAVVRFLPPWVDEEQRHALVFGTPAYMAPEQARGERQAVTASTDVWGLGVLLYQLLTGRLPFLRRESVLETILAVVQEEPPAPSQFAGDVPADLERVCLKCLEKDPQKRYATAAALGDDLERFLAGQPFAPRPASLPGRVGRWVRGWLGKSL